MELERENGIKALGKVLKQGKNCETIERYVYESCRECPENYKWYLYQTIGFLLQDIKSLKKVGKDIKEKRIGWNSPMYNGIASKIKEHDEYIVKPFDVVDGVVTCPKCGGSKTWSIQKQLRSGDEGMTTLSRCVTCGNHWSYSG